MFKDSPEGQTGSCMLCEKAQRDMDELRSQLAEREREAEKAVQDFIDHHHNPVVGQKNEEIAALTKEVERLNSDLAKKVSIVKSDEIAALTQKLKDAEAEISRLNGMVTSQLMANSGFKKRAEEAEATLGKMREALEGLIQYDYAMYHHAYCEASRSDYYGGLPKYVKVSIEHPECVCEERKRYLRAKEALSQSEGGQ